MGLRLEHKIYRAVYEHVLKKYTRAHILNWTRPRDESWTEKQHNRAHWMVSSSSDTKATCYLVNN